MRIYIYTRIIISNLSLCVCLYFSGGRRGTWRETLENCETSRFSRFAARVSFTSIQMPRPRDVTNEPSYCRLDRSAQSKTGMAGRGNL